MQPRMRRLHGAGRLGTPKKLGDTHLEQVARLGHDAETNDGVHETVISWEVERKAERRR